MPNKLTYTRIKFTMVEWENEFLVDFEIPFSLENFDAVVSLRNSRDIKLVR